MGVYPIKDSLIEFNVFEKKVPFEILEISKFNDEIFIIGGFSSQIAIVNSSGHFLQYLKEFEGSILLRKFDYNISNNFFTVISK